MVLYIRPLLAQKKINLPISANSFSSLYYQQLYIINPFQKKQNQLLILYTQT